jgi:hypothetical protein
MLLPALLHAMLFLGINELLHKDEVSVYDGTVCVSCLQKGGVLKVGFWYK